MVVASQQTKANHTTTFTTPAHKRRLWEARGIGLCAYLVTLAAFQRGLKVTFHYELDGKSKRFTYSAVQGYRGELFSLSDGKKTHYFRRSMGDLSLMEHSAVCESKELTKQLFRQCGIPVPACRVQKSIEAVLAA